MPKRASTVSAKRYHDNLRDGKAAAEPSFEIVAAGAGTALDWPSSTTARIAELGGARNDPQLGRLLRRTVKEAWRAHAVNRKHVRASDLRPCFAWFRQN